MPELSGCIVFLLCLLTFSLPQHNCRYNRRHQPLSRRIIENVTACNYREKFAEINLQNEPSLEFKNAHFPFFGEDIIHALNYSTKSITFRRGFVRRILISSPVLEVLQVINTDLLSLKAQPILNYSLRQLTIRSSEFSQWSPSLTFLRSLEEVDISYCNFSYLNMDWFKSFTKLRVLDVAKNKLALLDIGPAISMGSLKKFHLWGNLLERVEGFPEAFPKLEGTTLSQNRWHCDWLSDARNAIWSLGVVLMDMDGVCQAGWINNGGICCSAEDSWGTKVLKRKVTAKEVDLEVKKLVETLVTGSVIGMRMGDSVVFLDKPLVT